MEIKALIQTEHKLYRFDHQQIEFLAEVIAEQINAGIQNPKPNISRRKNGTIQHGVFKGYLDSGEKRTEYFEQVLAILTKKI